MTRVVHLLQGLRRGGMERGTLQLVQRARAEGHDDRLVLYDSPPETNDSYERPDGEACAFVPRAGRSALAYAQGLRAHLVKVRARIVHAHNQSALFYAALACLGMPARSRPRLVGTFHNRPVSISWRARQATRWAASRADMRVSVSESLARWLVDGEWVKDCEVIHSDVDTDRFTPCGPRIGLRARFGLPADALIIGHIGRFDDNKRQGDLIEAFRRIRHAFPGASLALAGEGPQRQTLEAAVRPADGVHFVGVLEDVPAFLRDIDVFVLCSLHEGLPRVLLEALACNRPVVTTRIAAISEVMDDAPHGLSVPPQCPHALAQALTALLSDAGLRQQLAAGGRQKVVTRFSADRHFQLYERVYAAMLEKYESAAAPRASSAPSATTLRREP